MNRGERLPVVSGSIDGNLAVELAKKLGWEHHALVARRFPDSEAYVRVPVNSIEAVRSEPVIVVATTFPDDGIVEALLMLEAIHDVRTGNLTNLKGEGPEQLENVGPGIILAVPYFGYSRQDKRFQRGEVISASLIVRLLARHIDGLIVLDLHAPSVLDNLEKPIEFVSAMPEIADYLKSNVDPDFILSPDKGAIERASHVANMIDCKFSYLEKTRIDAHTIEHKPKDLDVQGAVVAIVDDMISTGGTICKASDALLSQGAKEVHAACTHGLFTGGAITRLDEHVSGVHATDSIASNPRALVSSASALARGVNNLLERLNL
ncbi:MAG: ribose-phosphate diphosphokinase [Candidatus Thalassarchaeaceae archaeon]|jgi:ribose-phosphate pyrophosphokinase|nr:ribose-phosphate diphosphokinase [Candidatus Thalassarchaeaceae archaeon]MDP7043255.1 ribose-phosphate diphosphokinase [Candidatus Thalassarchaeaceae archaeon]